MKSLINRSYDAIRKRGLITAETDFTDFMLKMNEELAEIAESFEADDFPGCIKEAVDLMNVCICALKHHGYDPVKEFEKCVIHNETRKD